jgi:hypothetical protein
MAAFILHHKVCRANITVGVLCERSKQRSFQPNNFPAENLSSLAIRLGSSLLLHLRAPCSIPLIPIIKPADLVLTFVAFSITQTLHRVKHYEGDVYLCPNSPSTRNQTLCALFAGEKNPRAITHSGGGGALLASGDTTITER